MFWKKNKKKEAEDQKLFTAPPDNRAAFRINPPSGRPLIMEVAGKPAPVLNISSGGVRFENQGFEEGKVYPVKLTLPGQSGKISAQVKILMIEKDNTCRALFRGLTQENEEDIHYYVLVRQKEDLRERDNLKF